MEYNWNLIKKFQYIKKQAFMSIFFVVTFLFFISMLINQVSALSNVDITYLPLSPDNVVFNMVDLKIYVAHDSAFSIIDGITNNLLETIDTDFTVDAIINKFLLFIITMGIL